MNFLIPYFKIFHGLFNIVVMLLIIYQGWLGLRIRRNRIFSNNSVFKIIMIHRKIGPFLFELGLVGFLAGVTLIYIDKGYIFEYPLHFIVGLLISLSLVMTFFSSKKIRPKKTEWRKIHLKFGLLTILLYLIQVILGIMILL